jgi:hypothetical protein
MENMKHNDIFCGTGQEGLPLLLSRCIHDPDIFIGLCSQIASAYILPGYLLSYGRLRSLQENPPEIRTPAMNSP